MCEGYLDVIGAAAADISTAVASCGTALGSQHLQLLGRFADRVILAFDADTAGAKAAARLHHLEAQQTCLRPGGDAGHQSGRDVGAVAWPYLACLVQISLAPGSPLHGCSKLERDE